MTLNLPILSIIFKISQMTDYKCIVEKSENGKKKMPKIFFFHFKHLLLFTVVNNSLVIFFNKTFVSKAFENLVTALKNKINFYFFIK